MYFDPDIYPFAQLNLGYDAKSS